MGIAFLEYGREIQDLMGDVRLKAMRNILTIKNVRSLNGLYGLQHCSSMTNDENHNFEQLWASRTVNNCNLVEMPKSVKELSVTGEHRILNFVESFMPLNMRKEAENCLPAAFQFWALPKVKKLLDKKINLLVFGGKMATGN